MNWALQLVIHRETQEVYKERGLHFSMQPADDIEAKIVHVRLDHYRAISRCLLQAQHCPCWTPPGACVCFCNTVLKCKPVDVTPAGNAAIPKSLLCRPCCGALLLQSCSGAAPHEAAAGVFHNKNEHAASAQPVHSPPGTAPVLSHIATYCLCRRVAMHASQVLRGPNRLTQASQLAVTTRLRRRRCIRAPATGQAD